MLSKIFKRYYNSVIDVGAPVAAALSRNEPVVALETTILTHGMPFPKNLETALAVEESVKQQNSIPATIGVIDGRIKVGLDEKSFQILASPDTPKVKISRRDFPVVLSQRLNGGTTVSGTLLVAKRIGIDVFVTGGIGGVHRDVQESMDVSADVFELSRSPIMVVSSGIKSILDIGRTLEFLETLGVCVVTFGDTKDFPAFFTRKSGYQTPYNVTNVEQAADLLLNTKKLGLKTGILLGVPIPQEFSFDEQEIENAIGNALEHCKKKSISGKGITPFLLNEVKNATEGKSLESNIALIKNNAIVGGKIAFELKRKNFPNPFSSNTAQRRSFSTFIYQRKNLNNSFEKKVVVIGGSMMDIVVRANDNLEMNGGTLPGLVKTTAGGVARNMADALGKLLPNNSVTFISALGKDSVGDFLHKSLEHVNCEAITRIDHENSACCVVLLDNHRDCSVIIADMRIHQLITPDLILKYENILPDSALVVFDGNLSMNTIECILKLCKRYHVPVWFEPTDHTIAEKPLHFGKEMIHYCSPNLKELQKMVQYVTNRASSPCENLSEVLTEARDSALTLLPIIPNIMVTLGKIGLLMVTSKNEYEKPQVTFYKAIEPKAIENVSGVGDCLASGYIAGMLSGLSELECVSVGLHSAMESLESSQTVPNSLKFELLKSSLPFVELPLTGQINMK